jgi:energy-coupling factor transporter ATP-binding protein EcfA2
VGKLTSEQPWKKGNEGSFGELVAKWQSFHKHNEYLCNARRVIKSLHYPKIMERRSAIVPAHQRTFDWMFSSQTTANFAAWLASGFTPDISESIYWVCGNAGSGKSTLMKHLAYHSQTRERLQTEGIIKRLVITSHYFWSCGTSMQASKEGLLKSILAQVFQQLPEVVPLISPSRFQDMGALEHWTEQELLDCIEATAVLDPPVCLCLFVDGLDECSEDHVALLDLLRRLAGSLHTKLCVSSRPWIDFITAFKNSSWKLLLQDLTRADITLYVQEHLQAEPRFLHLERLDAAEAGTLAAEIVERAEGVFLWVFLVIRSLKRGLRNGDGMRDLHRRLSQMPSDLKDFFRQMLENIEELYAERTARTFQVMVLAGRTLPLLLFWFMDEEEFDPFYSLNMRVGPYSMDLILTFVADKKMQLIAQCKDLIIIHEQPDEPDFCAMQVGFLHRTVADYFQTSAIYELLKTRAGPMFDPRRTYCKAGLAQLKMMAKWPPSTAADLERVQLIWEDMQEFGEQIKLLGGVIEPPEINRARKLISGKRFRIL